MFTKNINAASDMGRSGAGLKIECCSCGTAKTMLVFKGVESFKSLRLQQARAV
jgi:hypothetical protein